MPHSIWHRDSCGVGRHYLLSNEVQVRFDDEDAIIKTIVKELEPNLFVEPALRLVLDSPKVNPERLILSIPCHSDRKKIFYNFAKEVYHSLQGYYISADPRSTHYGISNMLMEGKINNFLKREMERLIEQVRTRPDIAARISTGVSIQTEHPVPAAGTNFLTDTVKEALNIYVGYRFHAHGEGINHTQVFLPMEEGSELIDLVYYNLEQLLNQNLATYDEVGSSYLKVSDTLVYKELELTLQRAKAKENTRKKILNNVQFNLIFSEDPKKEYGEAAGDYVYDMLNRVQDEKIKEATRLSSELFASVMLKNQEIVSMNKTSIVGKTAKGVKVPKPPEKKKAKEEEKEKVLAKSGSKK